MAAPSPVVLVVLHSKTTSAAKKHKKKIRAKSTVVRALLDSGASRSLVSEKCISHDANVRHDATSWRTAAGTFKTYGKKQISWFMPEFTKKCKIQHEFAIMDTGESKPMYDMIIGRDILDKLNIIIDFKTNVVEWDNI